MKNIIAVTLSCLLLCACSGGEAGKQFGKKKLYSFDLDAETVERISNPKPIKPGINTPHLANMVIMEPSDWTGPLIPVVPADNPHTIVVTLVGHAKTDGDASSLWTAGFDFGDNMVKNMQEVMMPVTGLTELHAKAGKTFQLVSASGPISFKEGRNLMPKLSFERSTNLVAEKITVQVWSGMAPNSGARLFLSTQPFWIGAVMLCLWWFWFKRS